MRPVLVLFALAACHGAEVTEGSSSDPRPNPTEPTEPTQTTPTATETTPTDCEGPAPVVTQVDATRRKNQVNTVDLAVSLDTEATVAVACTRVGAPDDVLLFESTVAARDHALPLRGLVAGANYDCTAAATCPQSAAPAAFSVATDPPPAVLPQVVVSRSPTATSAAPPFVLMGHDRHCVGDTARALMFDVDGEIRWYDEGVPNIDIAFETQYLGGGLFSWGGGYYDDKPPRLFDVDGQDVFVPATEAAQSHVFHHDGKIVANGNLMMTMIETMSKNGRQWDGFLIELVDTVTGDPTWSYSAQRAVDNGDLPAGEGDPWHANWMDYQTDPATGDRLYVSLCNLGDILAIDAATKDVIWKFGDTGDFTMQYPDGSPVPDDLAWPQCEHGLEFVPFPGGGGGHLLVYDNGAHGRGYSRMTEYALDEVTHVATLDWTWTEPKWMEPSWGDADYLPDGHALATMGHACWSPYYDDVSSVVEVDPASDEVVWRMDFVDPNDAIYRAERVDACDLFPIAALCPTVAARYATLAPLLTPAR